MRPCWRAVVLGPLLALGGLGAGCAQLSLFSSQHYHGTPEIEQRLTSLESRVTAIETGIPSAPSQPLPEHAPILGRK